MSRNPVTYNCCVYQSLRLNNDAIKCCALLPLATENHQRLRWDFSLKKTLRWLGIYSDATKVSARIKPALPSWTNKWATATCILVKKINKSNSQLSVNGHKSLSRKQKSAKAYYDRLTSLNEVLALLSSHVLLEVSIDIAVDVSAARAANGTRLPHTHPTKWNAVHLLNKSTLAVTIIL